MIGNPFQLSLWCNTDNPHVLWDQPTPVSTGTGHLSKTHGFYPCGLPAGSCIEKPIYMYPPCCSCSGGCHCCCSCPTAAAAAATLPPSLPPCCCCSHCYATATSLLLLLCHCHCPATVVIKPSLLSLPLLRGGGTVHIIHCY